MTNSGLWSAIKRGSIDGLRSAPVSFVTPFVAVWRLLKGTSDDLLRKHQGKPA